MSDAAGAAFNFARATTRDALAHGCARPGFPSRAPSRAQLEAWRAQLESRSIRHVISLLGDDEAASYAPDGRGTVDDVMREWYGDNYTRTSMFAPGALASVRRAQAEARGRGEAFVAHCSGGAGRAGLALGVWVVDSYGVEAEVAAREVAEMAVEKGVKRSVDVYKLKYLLQNGTVAGFEEGERE